MLNFCSKFDMIVAVIGVAEVYRWSSRGVSLV